MIPIDFPETNCVFAKDQSQYIPLPAHRDETQESVVTSCWLLTWKEALRLLLTGRLWIQQMTYRSSLQPILPSAEKPDLVEECES